ncbi:glycosyltransferase [Lactobacillus helveticus]|uniref:glycosyltransferase n=1 Tax=Lactobacillus helveticus TaxID=1587 RepID=UPI001562ED04
MKYAIGKYICFVDSGDFVERNYLFQLLNKIKEEQADVVVCEFYFVNEDGRKNKIRKFNIPANDRNLNGRK